MSLQPHFRYLPVLQAQRDWGLFLTDCGYTEIGPGSPYPPQRHPDTYHFDWKKGRVLNEYQIVYITRGRGLFEARGGQRQTLGAGDVFVLFPGVWHRYAPDIKTGWDEQWFGIRGRLADHFMGAPFFQKKKPVLNVGVNEDLKLRFRAVVDTVERNPAGVPFSVTGDLLKILGLLLERVRKIGGPGQISAVVREAQNRILQRAEETIDFPALARGLGTSYTSFRRAFKQQTGLAPAQFQTEIRLNRARDLLATSDLSVSEISEQVGCSTVFYFSRAFKKKTGFSPRDYRSNTYSQYK